LVALLRQRGIGLLGMQAFHRGCAPTDLARISSAMGLGLHCSGTTVAL